MCSDDTPAHHGHGHQVLHEGEPSVVFDLEPVDSVTVTTLMDNVTDVSCQTRGRRTGRRSYRGIDGRREHSELDGGARRVAAGQREAAMALLASPEATTANQSWVPRASLCRANIQAKELASARMRRRTG
jgi:hypothetical protein